MPLAVVERQRVAGETFTTGVRETSCGVEAAAEKADRGFDLGRLEGNDSIIGGNGDCGAPVPAPVGTHGVAPDASPWAVASGSRRRERARGHVAGASNLA